MTRIKELQEIIKELSLKKDKAKNVETLLFIANLLYENYNEHMDSATLRRELFHGRLRIIADYRPIQPEPEETKKCKKTRLHR